MAAAAVKMRVVRGRPVGSRTKPFYPIGFTIEPVFPFKSKLAGQFLGAANTKPPVVKLNRKTGEVTCSLSSRYFRRGSISLSEAELTQLSAMFDDTGALRADRTVVRVTIGIMLASPLVLFEHHNGVAPKTTAKKK